MSDHAQDEFISNTPKSQSLWWAAVIVGLVGFAISLYSVNHHLELKAAGHTDAFCNVSSTVNCDAVASSKYAEIFGIPLGVYGAGYFLGMMFLAATTALGHKSRREHEGTWFLLSGAGVIASIAFAAISLGVLKTVCLVCVGTYVTTFIQAGIAFVISRDGDERTFDTKSIGNGLTSAAVALAIAVVAFNFLRPATELPKELQDLPGKHDGQNSLTLLPKQNDLPINRTPYSGAGEDYRLGNDEAKIVVVEFADYQCPACAVAKKVFDDLHKELGDRALIVFKNFPLSNKCNGNIQSDMHPYSCDISRLARCAGEYGKFWQYHTLAFEEQSRASLEAAKDWGRKVGLTDAQMDRCLTSPEILAKLRDDVDLGQKIGVDGTPSVFINGRKYTGDRSVSSIRAAIDSL